MRRGPGICIGLGPHLFPAHPVFDARSSLPSTSTKPLDSNPDNWWAANNLGFLLLLDNERIQEAFELVGRAFGQQPKNDFVAHSYGLGLLKMGRSGEAVHPLELATDRLSNEAKMYHLAVAYSREGETEKALNLCRRMKNSGRLVEFRNQVEEYLRKQGVGHLSFR